MSVYLSIIQENIRGDIMKKISFAILILMIACCLVACKNDEEVIREVIEHEIVYDYIGIKIIEVNEEIFTTFCQNLKEDDSGMWNTPGGGREYTDVSGKEYIANYFSPCRVLYDDTMYHGFDLLENGLLTIEELELLEFPFSEVLD